MYRPTAGICVFSRRYAIAIALTIFTIWLIREQGPDLETIRDFAHLKGGFRGGWISQSQFVRQALIDDIYVKGYNGTAVRKVCSEAKWREGLVVSCDEIAGGIGNLKMRVLGCARYAIEAGGMRDPMATPWPRIPRTNTINSHAGSPGDTSKTGLRTDGKELWVGRRSAVGLHFRQ